MYKLNRLVSRQDVRPVHQRWKSSSEGGEVRPDKKCWNHKLKLETGYVELYQLKLETFVFLFP